VNAYFETSGNFDMLSYNIVHNLGKVYDNTVAMIDLLRFGDDTNKNYWRNLGYYAGNSLNQIFYKPRNYDPFKVKAQRTAFHGY
jgi:hypothetical protein